MRILLVIVSMALPGAASGLESALPAGQQQPALRQSLLTDMRSAIASGQPATARARAARLLWQLDPTPEEARAARLVVIDSHLAEQQGAVAFRAMLRFDRITQPWLRDLAKRWLRLRITSGLSIPKIFSDLQAITLFAEFLAQQPIAKTLATTIEEG